MTSKTSRVQPTPERSPQTVMGAKFPSMLMVQSIWTDIPPPARSCSRQPPAYDRIVDKTLLARRLTLCANHLLDESSVPEDLAGADRPCLPDYSAKEKQKKEADAAHARERKLQETMLGIKKRFGKNAILKGLNLEDGATAKERNTQIGGHKA